MLIIIAVSVLSAVSTALLIPPAWRSFFDFHQSSLSDLKLIDSLKEIHDSKILFNPSREMEQG